MCLMVAAIWTKQTSLPAVAALLGWIYWKDGAGNAAHQQGQQNGREAQDHVGEDQELQRLQDERDEGEHGTAQRWRRVTMSIPFW